MAGILAAVVRAFAVVAAVACVAVGLASEALAQGRVALVIGNSAYRNVSVIPNPVNDASDVSRALQRLGFAVTAPMLNAGQQEMRRALVAFGRAAAGAEIAVVFYAGHGMEIAGENWLIPVDTELRSDTDAGSEAIALRDVMAQAAKASRLGLVILDACRNNPFARTMSRSLPGSRGGDDGGLARVEPTDNVLVAYSARDGTKAADGDGRNSPFTAALLRHIETPGLEVRFLFSHVRDDVLAATRRAQQPFTYGSLSSDPIFLARPGSSQPTAVLAPLRDEDIWRYVDKRDMSALRRFVRDFPGSVHAVEARRTIADYDRGFALPTQNGRTVFRRWDHNGSLLRLEADNENRRFVYVQPRSGLVDVGVGAGTVEFEGKQTTGGYQGKAYVFSKFCGAVDFPVSGDIAPDGRSVTMRGFAPYVTPDCKRAGGRDAVLSFRLMPDDTVAE